MSSGMQSINQVSALKPAAYGGKRSRKNRSSKRRGGSATLKMGGRKNRKHRKTKSNRRK